MSMEPDEGESRRQPRGVVAGDEDLRDARAVVDWYFGDLVGRIAGERSVSEDQLLAALTWVELAGRRRREGPTDWGESVPVPEAPGAIYRIPVETWREIELAQELSEAEAEAARAVHRKMARSVSGIDPGDGSEPFVCCGEPRDVMARD